MSASAPAKELALEQPPSCENCATPATMRLTPLDSDELDCCGECLLQDGGVLTLCKATCPNFAFTVGSFNAARTEATVETDDHLECMQCGKGYHCVRGWGVRWGPTGPLPPAHLRGCCSLPSGPLPPLARFSAPFSSRTG